MSTLHRTAAAGFVVFAMALAAVGAEPSKDQYPSHTLRNDKLSVLMYLPDAERGFYRSTRFDWSGQFGRVDYKGHVFYALWKSPHNPLDFEDVIGPVEEFGTTPLGFAEAKAGETFIKIGVGHLLKTEDPKYGFFKPYKIVNAPPWQIEKSDEAIQFRQDLTDDRGYGYQYTKRVVLLKAEPGFTIERKMKNTGTRPIATNHYNHNFTMIDNQRIGPGYRLVLAFQPTISDPEQRRLQGVARFEGNQMVFTGPVAPDKPLWCVLEGHKTVSDSAFTIQNTKSGASIKVASDYPLSRFAFWSAWTAICPEPFTEFTLQPGEEHSWNTRYVFSVDSAK